MSKPIVNHRRRYKVLNAPKIHPHVLAKFRRLTGLGEEIEPVFHRDGQYFDRLTKSAWAEIDGRAFSIDGNKFLEQVRLLSHRPLGMKVRRALITLREAGIKSNAAMSRCVMGGVCEKRIRRHLFTLGLVPLLGNGKAETLRVLPHCTPP